MEDIREYKEYLVSLRKEVAALAFQLAYMNDMKK